MNPIKNESREQTESRHAGRAESTTGEPTEQKRVSKKRHKTREKTTNKDSLKFDLVRRAF